MLTHFILLSFYNSKQSQPFHQPHRQSNLCGNCVWKFNDMYIDRCCSHGTLGIVHRSYAFIDLWATISFIECIWFITFYKSNTVKLGDYHKLTSYFFEKVFYQTKMATIRIYYAFDRMGWTVDSWQNINKFTPQFRLPWCWICCIYVSCNWVSRMELISFDCFCRFDLPFFDVFSQFFPQHKHHPIHYPYCCDF